jgi:cell division protein YceG involved in septum cleavage
MRRASILAAAVVVLALIVGAVFAAGAKTYQVTGPVLSVNDTMIVVQKGDDKWEIARDAGAKVTIQYRMIATSVEVKTK